MRVLVLVIVLASACSALALTSSGRALKHKLSALESQSQSVGTLAETIAKKAEAELAGIAAWCNANKSGGKPAPPGKKYWGYAKTGVNEWCSSFVSYVLNAAGSPINKPNQGKYGHGGVVGIPAVVFLKKWIVDHPQQWQWLPVTASSKPTPRRGDIIIFDRQKDGILDHTGIVVNVRGTTINTIEGNVGAGNGPAARKLDRRSYTNTNTIAGYGRRK